MKKKNPKKKSIRCLLLCLFLISHTAAGCLKSEPVNDETGQIPFRELKHTYTDGDWYAAGSHYDGNGYLPAMHITILEGIITSVDFDYFSAEGERYSLLQFTDDPDRQEESQDFHMLRRQYNQTLLANQNAEKLLETPDKLSRDYRDLLAVCIASSGSGADKELAENELLVPLTAAYTVSRTDEDTGIVSTLEASCAGETILSLSLVQTDIEGDSMTDNEEFTSLFQEENTETYPEAVTRITNGFKSDRFTVESDPSEHPPSLVSLYDVFNRLLIDLDRVHLPYDGNPSDLF